MSSETLLPEVLWAQRSSKDDPEKNYITMTINVPDIKVSEMKLEIKPDQINFSGISSADHETKKYNLELPLYAEVDESKSTFSHTPHSIKLKLIKKELKEEYWPRLQKDSKRLHFVKTDFDKWVDEDEQEEAPEEDFSQFGGMGGMPGMGGMGGMGGGMPGMGGMGGGGFDGIDFSKLGGTGTEPEEDDDEDDDDDMPALEGDEDDDKKPAAAKTEDKPKIEEIKDEDGKV